MDFHLEGKDAVVTGASQGIGKAIALRLAREGCNVAIGSRSEGDLHSVAEAIRSHDVEAVHVAVDLSTSEGVNTLFDAAIDQFGVVDVLVNNVGGIGKFAPFGELSDEDWLELFRLNVLSLVRATRHVLPGMLQQGWGRIINISSESGSQPDPEMPHYNATKAAIKNITKSLSKQYGRDGILINTVSPAFVKAGPAVGMLEDVADEEDIPIEQAEKKMIEEFRPHIELGRAGEVEEVANVVAFLASEAASFVHGSDYRVDGGSVASMVG